LILPTKHISVEHSFLGVGALMLQHLKKPKTIVALWNEMRPLPTVGTFQRFVLVLDLLYMMNAVTLEDGLIVRRTRRLPKKHTQND